MTAKKKVLAISGSTRAFSTNLNMIMAVAGLAEGRFSVTVFQGLTEIPHFNPDIDDENAGTQVSDLRRQLRQADGVLICTPEYAMGVPGTLKNAIDWTVSSAEFLDKPVALITASSLGEKGHASLLETLRVISANVTDDTQLLVSHAKLKVNNDGQITDGKTLTEVENLIRAFDQLLNADPTG
jgi:chromate reductase, NAD(P)H dehydrogenase (quinone)